MPHATTPWAKSLVDESAPTFAGTYSGVTGSTEETRRTVEDAAALILVGVQFTDLNSGLFSQRIIRAGTVELGARSASVGAAAFAPLELPTALAALEPLVVGLDPAWQETARFLRAGDIVLADQGTCFYGMAPHRLPADVTFVGQPLWASIGYTLPALLGAGLAQPDRRGVLLIGDGAAQLTVQELATVVAHRCLRSSSWSTTTATPWNAPSTGPTSRTTTSPAGTGATPRPSSARTATGGRWRRGCARWASCGRPSPTRPGTPGG